MEALELLVNGERVLSGDSTLAVIYNNLIGVNNISDLTRYRSLMEAELGHPGAFQLGNIITLVALPKTIVAAYTIGGGLKRRVTDEILKRCRGED